MFSTVTSNSVYAFSVQASTCKSMNVKEGFGPPNDLPNVSRAVCVTWRADGFHVALKFSISIPANSFGRDGTMPMRFHPTTNGSVDIGMSHSPASAGTARLDVRRIGLLFKQSPYAPSWTFNLLSCKVGTAFAADLNTQTYKGA